MSPIDPRRPIEFTRGITSCDAPDHTRAAVHAFLVGQMACYLCDHRIDLTNRSAARSALQGHGFGENSVTFLLDRAIAEASRSKMAVADLGGRHV
ncbi:hypothetical protein [Paracoccus sp. KR1-242]|uniref:hypothetical protein n=1 Tax=Paracoccus sp. KR1-242 TaxID=3410028 RepID=UPI003C0C8B3A